ncbi:endonuclease/exonuclease/phosphatase family protein [Pseudarthrobacter albicanus]|uniref:endonuclease/exonuclease/phosphatase family protein n=1 Tax=Pseudarthrobacter albicanus TaxID=2823873 RepID=UPI001FE3A3FB|nr:endonuclease/exonuclease/phosphatase family protein [Pseudarthrobacter albicanus]
MSLPDPGRPARLGPRRRGARAWRALALLTALPLAALAVFRAVPGEWPAAVEQWLAFTPWLVLPAAAGLLFALLGRRAWLVVVASGLLAVQLFWLFPQDYLVSQDNAGGTPRGTPAGGARTVQLKVMDINAELGGADAAEIVRLVRDNGIGLLTIQEHTPALQERLAAQGLDSLLPNRISRPVNGAAGSAFYSLHPMQPLGALPDSQFQVPTVRLVLDAGGQSDGQSDGQPAVLDVTNVHAQPPIGGRIERWRSDLAAIGTLTAGPGNLLLVGDFNATYDHSEFRQILHGGPGGRQMVDAGTAAGSRLVPTWPMDGQLLPGVVIDHLVTSPQVRATAYSVHRVAGTDHAAIMATLAVPAAP